jgi:hypothetical protein
VKLTVENSPKAVSRDPLAEILISGTENVEFSVPMPRALCLMAGCGLRRG